MRWLQSSQSLYFTLLQNWIMLVFHPFFVRFSFQRSFISFTRHRQYPPPLERAQEAKELWGRPTIELFDHERKTRHTCVIMREQCDGSIFTWLQVCYIYTGLKSRCQIETNKYICFPTFCQSVELMVAKISMSIIIILARAKLFN